MTAHGLPRSYPVNIKSRVAKPPLSRFIKVKCRNCGKLLSARRDAAGIVCECDAFNPLYPWSCQRCGYTGHFIDDEACPECKLVQ